MSEKVQLQVVHECSAQGEFSLKASSIAVRVPNDLKNQNQVLTLAIEQYEPRLIARYAAFNVVKPFMRHVLRLRPDVIHFDYLCTDTADLAKMVLALGIHIEIGVKPNQADLGPSPDDQRWHRSLLAGYFTDQWQAAELGLSARPGYEAYAFSARNNNLLILWVERVLRFFLDRASVLDLGCGTGVFLDQLTRRGINVCGVDDNPASVRYARLQGLNAIVQDGLSYLDEHPTSFGAIHCSHLVEHLPFDQLQSCIEKVARALVPGGIAVLVFPDPESIRSQLLGFWRDPDHVRFYHPDTLELLANAAGLDLEFNSQYHQPRSIVGFSPYPPEELPDVNESLFDAEDLPVGMANILGAIQQRLDQQESWIRKLWDVNQTWAWADDAVLVFRRDS